MPGPARAPLVERARRTIARWPYTALLLLLSAALTAAPLLGGGVAVALMQQSVLIALIYGAAVASGAPLAAQRAVAGLVALRIGLGLMESAAPHVAPLTALNLAVSIVLGLGTLLLTARGLFVERERGADALAGAAFGYLLLAVVWAVVYAQIEAVRPGSFLLIEDGGPVGDQLFYFSLVTLTTLGYGDIVAATPLTRLFTALEAAQGALYLAIFIGRLLSTFQEEQRREDRIREARQREGRGRD
jgi:hypothetical protein